MKKTRIVDIPIASLEKPVKNMRGKRFNFIFHDGKEINCTINKTRINRAKSYYRFWITEA